MVKKLYSQLCIRTKILVPSAGKWFELLSVIRIFLLLEENRIRESRLYKLYLKMIRNMKKIK